VLQSNIDIIPTGTYAGIFRGETDWMHFSANLLCNSMLVYIVNAQTSKPRLGEELTSTSLLFHIILSGLLSRLAQG
jgi:hypothetical protein